MGGRRRRGRAEKEGETRRERDAQVSETQHRCSNVCTEPGQSPPGVEMEQRDHHSLLKKKKKKKNATRLLGGIAHECTSNSPLMVLGTL